VDDYRSSRICNEGSVTTDMRRLTKWMRSEKCVVTRFRRCANVMQSTDTNLDSMACYRCASFNDGDAF
jgi:hypothetical protein